MPAPSVPERSQCRKLGQQNPIGSLHCNIMLARLWFGNLLAIFALPQVNFAFFCPSGRHSRGVGMWYLYLFQRPPHQHLKRRQQIDVVRAATEAIHEIKRCFCKCSPSGTLAIFDCRYDSQTLLFPCLNLLSFQKQCCGKSNSGKRPQTFRHEAVLRSRVQRQVQAFDRCPHHAFAL